MYTLGLKQSQNTNVGDQVFTQNIKRVHRVARAIEAGMVMINSSNDSDYRYVLPSALVEVSD